MQRSGGARVDQSPHSLVSEPVLLTPWLSGLRCCPYMPLPPSGSLHSPGPLSSRPQPIEKLLPEFFVWDGDGGSGGWP